MQATWSDTNFEENDSTTSKDAKYNPNGFFAFIAFMGSMHDNECDSDSDSDDEFTNDQKVIFLIILF